MSYSGKLYIDGEDAMLTHGIFVADGSYTDIIALPKFKTVDSTEWPDEDGEEYDLLEPVLADRSIDIEFYFTNADLAKELFAVLTDGDSAYHTFYFAEIDYTLTLRMSKASSFNLNYKLGKFKLTLNDDFPAVPEGTPYELGETEVWQQGYTLDDYDFSQFGVWVLGDTDDELRMPPKVRSNLEIDNTYVAGVTYDDAQVVFESRETTITCLIDCDGIDEFWTRWNALFYVLLQPEERTFSSTTVGDTFTCFYNSVKVKKFTFVGGKVWCQFELNLTNTGYRPESSYEFLASEDDYYIVTEDGQKVYIYIGDYRYLSSEDDNYIVTEDEELICIND